MDNENGIGAEASLFIVHYSLGCYGVTNVWGGGNGGVFLFFVWASKV